jgi:type I restriction-modification system DNA methylase subunit
MVTDFAYSKIENLVQKHQSLTDDERRQYNEANTQNHFIIPLFEALGWNFADVNQVSAEEKISRGWVDYAFRLDGLPRFFLETKRLDEDLSDPRWIRQAIDYAWTKGVTWAVLSNFKELIVFNAEWKEENPLRATFIRFNVDTYLTDIERLWWLSRTETQQRRLDREAEQVGKKAHKEPVTELLFADLKAWRAQLVRHLRAYNQAYAPAQIDEAVLRILNRLIFIRTAEDREAEPPRLLPLLRELADRKRMGQLPQALTQLFRELDTTYNSDLFAEHFSEQLDYEPDPMRQLIEDLHEKRGGYVRYNFNAIDADVLGTVYEQYLGQIATPATDTSAQRKTQGIYYTPTFVVKHIIQQTLGRHLSEHGYDAQQPPRVLDMACGSGSFLIEAFDVLDRFVAHARGQTNGTREDGADHARRMEILTQCIYGVDKDEQAVAVAKLNLALKVLRTRNLIPMLHNVRAGDSLIAGAAEELKKAFGKNWQTHKPFNWETEFAPVMRAGGFDVIISNPPYVRTENIPPAMRDFFTQSGQFKCAYKKFDLYVLFLERALSLLRAGGRLGFIIPYSFLNQTYAEPLRRLILESACIESIVDLSGYRVFQAASVETCIVTLRKEQQTAIRRKHYIKVIAQETYDAGIEENGQAFIEIQQANFERTPQAMFRLDLKGAVMPLLEKIEQQSFKLGQLCYVSKGIVAYAESDGRKKADFLHLKRKNKRCVPYLEGKDVQRYVIDFKGWYLDYQPAVMARPTFRELHEKPKLLIRAIAQGLLGAYDAKQHYADQKLICCVQYRQLGQHRQVHVPDDVIADMRFDDKFILGLVNSRLLSHYYHVVLFSGLSILPEDVRQLPIRRINFADPIDQQRHEHVVALVTEMLSLQRDYAEAERAKTDERHGLQRRIDELDAEIDRVVYALYRLTEAEIKIIGKHHAQTSPT